MCGGGSRREGGGAEQWGGECCKERQEREFKRGSQFGRVCDMNNCGEVSVRLQLQVCPGTPSFLQEEGESIGWGKKRGR